MPARRPKKYPIQCEGEWFTVMSPWPLDLMVTRYWQNERFYEGKLLQQIRKRAPKHGVYIDVGANQGNHSVFFANFCDCTKLISIEAVWEVYDVMVRNVVANNRKDVPFEACNWAISNKSQELAEYDTPFYKNIGGTEMRIRPRNHQDTMPAKPNNSVLTIKLDDLIPVTDDVAVLKMDIEGGEAKAIVGGADMIMRCKPLLIAEARTAENLKELDELMKMFQYDRVEKNYKKGTHIWSPR